MWDFESEYLKFQNNRYINFKCSFDEIYKTGYFTIKILTKMNLL